MKKPSLKDRALLLLTQREHSEQELVRKLKKAGFERHDIDSVLSDLKQAGLQDDQRFAEQYIHVRSHRGFGSQRIRQELQERGVANECIEQALAAHDTDWVVLARQTRRKRFGEPVPHEYKDKMKQQRFLYYRGFTHEQIFECFNSDAE